MIGRQQVHREKQRIDATFRRALSAEADPELLSDLARYLCVLVSGFLEQAVIELLLEYVRLRSNAAVQRHVERRLRWFTSAKAKNIAELLGSFDPDWQRDLEAFLDDERRDAVDSVVNLRQNVSHGHYVGVTLRSIESYYKRVKEVVDHVAGICACP